MLIRTFASARRHPPRAAQLDNHEICWILGSKAFGGTTKVSLLLKNLSVEGELRTVRHLLLWHVQNAVTERSQWWTTDPCEESSHRHLQRERSSSWLRSRSPHRAVVAEEGRTDRPTPLPVKTDDRSPFQSQWPWPWWA